MEHVNLNVTRLAVKLNCGEPHPALPFEKKGRVSSLKKGKKVNIIESDKI
jgi:hypothetical protein